MRRTAFILLFVTIASAGCASTGGGDPLVIKAENVLVNSLAVYKEIAGWHQTHSTSETPGVYRAIEAYKQAFPPLWDLLDRAVQTYKQEKAKGLNPDGSALKLRIDQMQNLKVPAKE